MHNSELVATCMAVTSNIVEIATEIGKKDGVSKQDVLKLCVSAVLCGADASLMDMLEMSMDDKLDELVSKACAKKRG